jgi:hypothetical protein
VQHVSRDMQGPLGERMISARRESTSRARRGGAELTAECSRGRAAPPQPGHWPSSDAGQAPGPMPSVRAGPSTDAEDRQQLPGNTLGSRTSQALSSNLIHRLPPGFYVEQFGCWLCSLLQDQVMNTRQHGRSRRGDRRRPNLNGNFVIFVNKRVINAENYLTNGAGQKNFQNSQTCDEQ